MKNKIFTKINFFLAFCILFLLVSFTHVAMATSSNDRGTMNTLITDQDQETMVISSNEIDTSKKCYGKVSKKKFNVDKNFFL